MPFGPGLQPGEPPLLNRPTVATAPDRAAARGGSGHRMDVRWSRRRDSNPEPAVYKTAALPIELRRRAPSHTAGQPVAPANDTCRSLIGSSEIGVAVSGSASGRRTAREQPVIGFGG